MSDLFHYFRIEARELIDELTVALSELAQGGPAGGPAGIALRHAHTLKGAARVVARNEIADQVHELEELLGPFRNAVEPVPTAQLDPMLALVDRLSSALEAAEGSAEEATERSAEGSAQPTGVLPVAPRATGTTPLTGTSIPAGSISPTVTTSLAGPFSGDTGSASASATGDAGTISPTTARAVAAPIPVPRASSLTTENTRGQEPGGPAGQVSPAQTARASLLEIDSLIDGVSQTRTQLGTVRDGALRVRRLRAAVDSDGRLTEKQIDELSYLARTLETTADRIDRELREVYTTAERLRLIPVETIVPDLERGLRDVTAAQGKRARLEVRGAKIALDATILAGAHTALRQIVRNAVAHGVEMPEQRLAAGKDEIGLVRVEISHGAAGVRFRCTDDGRGIDVAAVRHKLVQSGRAASENLDEAATLQLLLGSGISTADTVSEISGHGIGLDVVQDVVRRIGGRIEISTSPGQGTTIDLTTPASMTAQEVVLVRACDSQEGGDLLALPMRAVRQAKRISVKDFSGALAVMFNGRRTPYVPLADVLGLPGDCPGVERNGRTVLVLEGAGGPVAIGVSRLVGTAEVAVRAIPALAPVPPLVCGIWIDIDGRPRPVLDPAQVATTATQRRVLRVPAFSSPTPLAEVASVPVPILIVDDSLTTRMLERSILQAAGYRVDEAGSAEEGLAMAARQRYAVAVVDVEMPGMDGFAFIEQTRTRPELRHMPCILVTTKASPADRERGRAAGARAHIDKGEFHQSTLLDAVASLVAGSSPGSAPAREGSE